MTRRAGTVAALAIGLAVRADAVRAQDQPPGQAPVPTVTRLVQLFAGLEAQWLKAVRERDEAALGALLADDFEMRLASRPGVPIPRADWIRHALAGPPAAWAMSQVAARDLGGPVIVSFRLEPGAGARGVRDALVVDVWAQVKGTWKAAARYAGPAEGGPLGLPGEAPGPLLLPKKY